MDEWDKWMNECTNERTNYSICYPPPGRSVFTSFTLHA